MKSLNKVTLIGNLGQDPELKYTHGGDAVASFALATSESWKDKTSAEIHEKTEWHRCVAWKKLAEIVGQYARKGQKLYVEGKLQTRKWTDRGGGERYSTEVQVNDLILLGKGEGGERTGSKPPQYGGRKGPAAPSTDLPFDDDLPF